MAGVLARHGRCLVVDCHSFPSSPLPYERGPGAHVRPDICIGTDAFHTSEATARAFVQAFAANGWSVELNRPFAGALVPASRYRQDARVSAVMVEVNRRLYLHEASATRRPDFDAVAAQVRACWGRAGGVGVGLGGAMGPVGASLASQLPVGASLLATLHSP